MAEENVGSRTEPHVAPPPAPSGGSQDTVTVFNAFLVRGGSSRVSGWDRLTAPRSELCRRSERSVYACAYSERVGG